MQGIHDRTTATNKSEQKEKYLISIWEKKKEKTWRFMKGHWLQARISAGISLPSEAPLASHLLYVCPLSFQSVKWHTDGFFLSLSLSLCLSLLPDGYLVISIVVFSFSILVRHFLFIWVVTIVCVIFIYESCPSSLLLIFSPLSVAISCGFLKSLKICKLERNCCRTFSRVQLPSNH